MNSNKFQQLLKVDPLRPPVKHEKNKPSLSSISQKSILQCPAKNIIPLSPISTKKSPQILQNKREIEKNDWNQGENEKVQTNLLQLGSSGGEKESPYFRNFYFILN